MLSNSKLSSQSDELFVSAAVQLCEVMAEVAFSEGKIWICHWCQNWRQVSVYVEPVKLGFMWKNRSMETGGRASSSQLCSPLLNSFVLSV